MRGGKMPVIGMALLLSAAASAEDPIYRFFDGSSLTQGRVVWLANCESCHGYGIAGAPIPMQPDEWRERLKQDRQTLHRHAIEGFYGPDDTVMPARGGNADLSDDEVRLAVDYMTQLATYYLQSKE
jgi:cytochrome c oxidase cbb3-type subunit 3